MTDIDTAGIRTDMEDGYEIYPSVVRLLCDALDAARAEAKCDHGKWRCKWGSDQRARAEAAEARIAAALAVLDENDREDANDRNSAWPNPLLWGYTRTAAVRRALTGDTE